MYLVLKQVSGTATLSVRKGQRVTIGRTQWSDYAFPHDEGMEPMHFAVEYAQAGAIALPLEDAVLLVDGEPTQGAALRHGQVLKAGQTTFKVLMEELQQADAPIDPDLKSLPDGKPAVDDGFSTWVSAAQTLQTLLLPPIAEDALPATPIELAQLLESTDRQGDAIQVLAWSIDHADAVGWAADCVQNYQVDASLPDAEQAALTAARTWCEAQTEANCVAAGTAAEAAGLEGPTGWVAQAVFWGGDNLSTPDLPPVKPPPTLASAGIKGAIVALAFAVNPDAPHTVMSECLAAGYQLARQ